jgi:hypothetical protein
MSTLTRKNTLAASVLAAVRGKMKTSRMEDDPEVAEDEIVDDDKEKDPDADGEEKDPDAEGDEKDPDAEDDPNDPDAEGEDKGDEGKTTASSVRNAERGRIKGILMHPMADASPALAAELAFGDRAYSVKDAGALLTSAASGGTRLADRMNGRSPKLGSGTSVTPKTEKQSVLAGVGATIKAMHGRNGKGA